jgi:2-polyprenyl-6-methoxyphenol hydroxylase-like FAD-dependent oxidoreductase
LPTRFPFLLVTPQYETERVLEERVEALGVPIVKGAEVTGLRQDDAGVTVDVRNEDGSTQEWHASYVVGCDGVHSAVRKAIGVPYPGKSALRSIMLADVRLARPPSDVLTVNGNGDGFAFIAPFGDGWFRIIAWNRAHQVPDSEPVDFDELTDLTHRVLGTDFGAHDPRWMSRFHSDERQAPSYRVGRVFLAGDAAHCHSPAGGLGMNTGLQDAANLGWRLVSAIRGWVPDGNLDAVLDGYQAERHPVGRLVLRASGALLDLATLRYGMARFVRGVLAGAASHVAPLTHRVAGVISGIGIAYDHPAGAHPSVGKRIGDLPLDGGSRLFEALRMRHFVLLGHEIPDGWSDRVDAAVPAIGDGAVPVTLVRPDGYVAWAAEHPDLDSVRQALETWCGTPSA